MDEKKKNIYFSIIIPCYNVEKYIKNTIFSILNQEYKNFEIIIVNDGSTDRTLEIINQIKDKRIKILTQINSGVSEARNLGIKFAEGEYIAFIDGDDTVEKNFLKDANSTLNSLEVGMFSFGYRRIDENGNCLKKFANTKHSDRMYKGIDFLKMFLTLEIPQSVCSFIISRGLTLELKSLFDKNLSKGEDTDFQIRFLLQHQKINIFYSSSIYYNYLDRAGSAVNSKTTKKDFLFLDKFCKEIRNEKNQELKKYFYQYFTICIFYLLKEVVKKGSSLSEKDIKIRIKKFEFIFKKIKIFKFDKYSILKIIYFINYRFLLFLLKNFKR